MLEPEERKMTTDNPTPLVRISFTGLLLFCMNKREEPESGPCEIGVIECVLSAGRRENGKIREKGLVNARM